MAEKNYYTIDPMGKLTCLDILTRDMGSRLETCPDLIGECYEKIMEILEGRNLI